MPVGRDGVRVSPHPRTIGGVSVTRARVALPPGEGLAKCEWYEWYDWMARSRASVSVDAA